MIQEDLSRTDRLWLDYAFDVLTRDGGPTGCCVVCADGRIARWPGYIGPDYANGRVLFVGAIHNERLLFQAPTTRSLGAAAESWISSGRKGDAEYLSAMRKYYPPAAKFWKSKRGVFRHFQNLRRDLGGGRPLAVEQIAIANLAKCYAPPEKKDPAKKYSRAIAECPNPGPEQKRFPLYDLVERLNPAIILIATTSAEARLDGVEHDGRSVFQFQNLFGSDRDRRKYEEWVPDAARAYRKAMGLPPDVKDSVGGCARQQRAHSLKVADRGTDPDVIRLKRPLLPGEEIAPQARGIVTCLEANGGTMSKAELLEGLPKFIKTVQPPLRIFSYYRDLLIHRGIIAATSKAVR